MLFGAPSFFRASAIVHVGIPAASDGVLCVPRAGKEILRNEDRTLAASMNVEMAAWNLHRKSNARRALAALFIRSGKYLVKQLPNAI